MLCVSYLILLRSVRPYRMRCTHFRWRGARLNGDETIWQGNHQLTLVNRPDYAMLCVTT